VLPLQDELQMVAHLPVQPVVLPAVWIESVLAPAQAQPVLLRAARSQARGSEPSVQLSVREAPQPEQPLPALRVRLASSQAQQEPPGQPVLQPREQHSLAGAPQLPRASSAQPSPRHPSLLFLP
jgi:hypothetical protein